MSSLNTDEEIIRLQSISQEADVLKAFQASEGYKLFEKLILQDIEQGILRTIKDPSFDPLNQSMVCQLKALSQTIDLIRESLAKRIRNGENARLQILSYSTLKEGESNE